MNYNERQFLTQREAADLLRVSQITLYNWRRAGYGPAWAQIGGKIMYSHNEITKFFNENLQKEARA